LMNSTTLWPTASDNPANAAMVSAISSAPSSRKMAMKSAVDGLSISPTTRKKVTTCSQAITIQSLVSTMASANEMRRPLRDDTSGGVLSKYERLSQRPDQRQRQLAPARNSLQLQETEVDRRPGPRAVARRGLARSSRPGEQLHRGAGSAHGRQP